MALARSAASFGSGLGSSSVAFGSAGALLCFLNDDLLGFGRSIIERSGEAIRSFGDVLLSDFDVGLLCVGALGAGRVGCCTVSSGIGGICVTDPNDNFPRMWLFVVFALVGDVVSAGLSFGGTGGGISSWRS